MKKLKICSVGLVLILLISTLLFSCNSYYSDDFFEDDGISDDSGDADGDDKKEDNSRPSSDISPAFFVESIFEPTQYGTISVDVHAGYLNNFYVGYQYTEEEERTFRFVIYREIYKDYSGKGKIYVEDLISSVAVCEIEDFSDIEKYYCVKVHYGNGDVGRSLPPLALTDLVDTITEDGDYVLVYTIRAFDSDGNKIKISSGVDSSYIRISKKSDMFKLKLSLIHDGVYIKKYDNLGGS